jgi:methoxymalonate biosynthesis protein
VTAVKCVVWDLDDTVWPGVAVESDEAPEPRPRVLALVDELERRGIVSSVASRGDPETAGALVGRPPLRDRFVAPQVGWDPKSAAVRRIADRLRIGLDAIAYVDEDPFERAELAHLLPEVSVLTIDGLEAALAGPGFTPPVLTDEGRRRASLYREDERRRAAEAAFAGDREAFLRGCDMRLEVAWAGEADVDRLAELAVRTHRLSSDARRHGRDDVARWLRGGGLARARLADRFGDHGVVGLLALERPAGDPRVALLAVSCRVEGRGVPAALLRWAMDRAREGGADGLEALYRANGRNVRVALLLRQLGFRRAAEEDGAVVLRRPLAGELPPYPAWLRLT